MDSSSIATIPIVLLTGVLTIAYSNIFQPASTTHRQQQQDEKSVINKNNNKFDDDENPFPKAKPHAFGGIIGTALMPILLPSICLWLYYSCNEDNLITFLPTSSNFLYYNINPFANGIITFITNLWDFNVFCVYIIWILWNFFLYLIIPGEIVEGMPLRVPYQNIRLKYRINALKCHFISFFTLIVLVYYDILSITYGYDHFIQLFTSSWICSFILSICLYLHSYLTISNNNNNNNVKITNPLNLLSLHGNSDYTLYDFWMGRTLNPRLGFLDLKYVIELRPGLHLWAFLNISNLCAQYHRNFGFVSYGMIMTCIGQYYYILDSNISEKAILSTIDIISDGLGFMLCFGSLTWVPFTYTQTTRFLVNYDPVLEWYWLIMILILNFIGMYIFRSANNEKNMFKKNPNSVECQHLEFILVEKTGRKLICSSWWGMSRHINYFGDWLMALSWSLVAGPNLMAYFYPIYFAALLIGRQQRDDEKCAQQYGEAWVEYCKRVPYKIIPYIY